jgi:hypothetical protein
VKLISELWERATKVVRVFRDSGERVEYVESSRNLGITYDRRMSFKAHIDNVVRTAGRRLSNLGKVRHLMPTSLLRRTIETSVIYPMMYGCAAWGGCTKSELQRVQRMQNWAAKLIAGLRKYDHCSHVIKDLGWLTVEELVEVKIATMAYAAAQGKLGTDLQGIFKRVHSYDTRAQTVAKYANDFVALSQKFGNF